MSRHYLDETDLAVVQDLIRRNGLRPVVDAIGAAARKESKSGHSVLNEHGERMSREDVLTAAFNLTNCDLF